MFSGSALGGTEVVLISQTDQQSVKCLEHLKCQFFNIFGLTNILTSKQYLES